MKRIILLSLSLLLALSAFSQDITGSWNGVLNELKLRLVFHIAKTGDSYTSTMDSPDQKAFGIPVTATTFDGLKLSLAVSNIGLLYEGELRNDSIVGTFKQNVFSVPMILTRTPQEVKPVARPQDPKPPYPYRSEEVTFENKSAGITLAGTLTMPPSGNNFPAVILIAGSGAQNRNEEIMGHKPFLVIADYLTRQGIAVLRYDKRGIGQSTGDFRSATTADFAADAESAVAYLKTREEINPHKIGLIGHSEGGIIVPMIAARSNDVAFIVMLAGSGIRGDSLLLLQNELIAKASGMPEDKIARGSKLNTLIFGKITSAKDSVTLQEMTDFMTTLKSEAAEFIPNGMNSDDFIKNSAMQMTNPWMQYFLRYDPAPALEKVKCPVLALDGEKDLQIAPKENLSAISAALKKGGNKKATVKEYPDLNHLFQHCTTGLPSEYSIIEETISPEVLHDIAEWMMQVVR